MKNISPRQLKLLRPLVRDAMNINYGFGEIEFFGVDAARNALFGSNSGLKQIEQS
jgi:hypothetical protein